ncbi:LOW QUALITY PROTEIN: protein DETOXIFICATION 33-like [Wolffia australiana]
MEPREENLLESLIGEEDRKDVSNCRSFFEEAASESERLWYLAGPATLNSVCKYSLGAVTQVFAGHLTTLELDAVSTENMVIAGLAFGIMYGMGSALETLCGQAYGAKQYHMMGIYLQRSWVILTAMCICLTPVYLFATPILRVFGQQEEIAVMAGRFSIYMIPQLFAYGFNFPIEKFLQAQSKVMISAWVSVWGLLLHLLLSWVLIVQFGLGLAGAAASLNISWWFVIFGQIFYVLQGQCPGVWTGFSWAAFYDLSAFARLSIASAVMLCLDFWYYTFLIVLAGCLRNPEVSVAAISICINLSGWELMVFIGLNAAISVRVSNELGARRPKAARFSIIVVVLFAAFIGVFSMILVLSLRDVYGIPFINSPVVGHAVSDLGILLSFSLLLNGVQNVLNGVAVGAGWQFVVAWVNICCYYIVGLPVGFFLGHFLDLGIKGVWGGMISGVLLQTFILAGITFFTDWNKEASLADSRIKKWGGRLVENKQRTELGI